MGPVFTPSDDGMMQPTKLKSLMAFGMILIGYSKQLHLCQKCTQFLEWINFIIQIKYDKFKEFI